MKSSFLLSIFAKCTQRENRSQLNFLVISFHHHFAKILQDMALLPVHVMALFRLKVLRQVTGTLIWLEFIKVSLKSTLKEFLSQFFNLISASFEDKRKENYDKGQAELERRRKALADMQKKEQEERERKEREEAEKRERARIEAEMRKQQEIEQELRRQKELELEREEQRKRDLEKKEQARK